MRFTNFAVRAHWRAGLAVTALVLPGLIMAGATAAAASTATAAATGSAAATGAAAALTGKPVPSRPPSTPGAQLGAAIPAKPAGLPRAVPLTSWSVSLTASPNLLWPTQYSSLTATANSDVGPTPYYLRIYDVTTGAYVVTCATGTTCSAPSPSRPRRRTTTSPSCRTPPRVTRPEASRRCPVRSASSGTA